jgi:hypothetical protein
MRLCTLRSQFATFLLTLRVSSSRAVSGTQLFLSVSSVNSCETPTAVSRFKNPRGRETPAP